MRLTWHLDGCKEQKRMCYLGEAGIKKRKVRERLGGSVG